jgi:hypothetical protein
MAFKQSIGMALSALSLLSACSHTVVRKSQLQKIQSVAVLSWFASERISEVRGVGVVRKMDAEGKLQIAEDSLAEFQDAFAALGWEIIDTNAVVSQPSYKKAFEKNAVHVLTSGKASQAFAPRYFTPSEMVPIWLNAAESPGAPSGRRLAKTDAEALALVLSELGVDSGILLQIRFCFRTFENRGRERVVVSATSGLQIVNQSGHVAFEKSVAKGCGETARGESHHNAPIDGEDWMYDPLHREELRTLYREASRAEAQRLVASIPFTPRNR